MRIESLLIYFFTWLLLALTPGPAVMCIMSQSARYGLQAGFRGILGIQIGNIVFFLCIAFGLAALLATATNAFAVLQIAGQIVYSAFELSFRPFGSRLMVFSHCDRRPKAAISG
jgi:threonine/homoserine/homoserine lactone efflux protein